MPLPKFPRPYGGIRQTNLSSLDQAPDANEAGRPAKELDEDTTRGAQNQDTNAGGQADFLRPPDLPPPREDIPSCLILSKYASEDQLTDPPQPPQPIRLNTADILGDRRSEEAQEEKASLAERKESLVSPSPSPRAPSLTSDRQESGSAPSKQESVGSVSSSSST